MGGLRRVKKQVLARFQFLGLCPTVLAGAAVTPFGLPTVLRFARFRVIGISLSVIGHKFAAKRRKPQKVGHLSVPASRGRALSISTTVNKVRMIPERFAATETPQTRDLGLRARRYRCDARQGAKPCARGLGTRVQCNASNTNRTPVVARLSVSLAARDQGTKCVLSMVADSAGARPRKSVKGRMAKFDRFLLFSASLERH